MKRLSSIVVVFLLFLNTASADNLPRVTGLNLEGDLLTWDAQWGAVGYNIYLDFEYFDTVGDVQEYTVTEPGKYHVISFNGRSCRKRELHLPLSSSHRSTYLSGCRAW